MKYRGSCTHTGAVVPIQGQLYIHRGSHAYRPAYQKMCWDQGALDTSLSYTLSLLCVLRIHGFVGAVKPEPEVMALEAHDFKHQLPHSVLDSRVRPRVQGSQAELLSTNIFLHSRIECHQTMLARQHMHMWLHSCKHKCNCRCSSEALLVDFARLCK